MNRHRVALDQLLDQLEADLVGSDYRELAQMAQSFADEHIADEEMAAFDRWKELRAEQGLSTRDVSDMEC